MTIEQIYETKGASYMEWLENNKDMTQYRIVEEKYPSYSLWIPESNKGNGWKAFTVSGRPYDRLILHNKSEAEFYVNQEKQKEEFEKLEPEIIYHEIK
jgi:hypothetical protein